MRTAVIIFQLLTTIAVFATGDTGGTPYNASRVKAPSVSATAASPAPTPSIAEICLAAIQMCRLKEANQDQCPDNGGKGCLTVRQVFAEFQCEGHFMDDERCEPTIEMVFGKDYIVHTQEMAACSKIAAERQLCQPEFDQAAFYAENGIYVNVEAAERCLVSHLQMKPYQHNTEAQDCIAGIVGPYGPFEQHPEPMVAPGPLLAPVPSSDGSLNAPSLSEGSLAAPRAQEEGTLLECAADGAECGGYSHGAMNQACCSGYCNGKCAWGYCYGKCETRDQESVAEAKNSKIAVPPSSSPQSRPAVEGCRKCCFPNPYGAPGDSNCKCCSRRQRRLLEKY